MSKPTSKGVEPIISLIHRNEFGWFSLHDQFEAETYTIFPPPNGNESVKATPENLATALQQTLEDLGPGIFKIHLKNTSKSNNTQHATLRFSTMSEGSAANNHPNVAGLGGLGYEKLESLLEGRAEKVRQEERTLADREKRLSDMEWNMKLLQLEQRLSKKPEKKPEWVQPLMALGTTLTIAVVSKIAPESLPVIQKAMEAMQGQEEEEEEIEQINRTD